MNEIQQKIDGGYRLVKFSEVDDAGAIRGEVIQTLVQKKYYSDLKLDGGQLSFKRRCKDNHCDKPIIVLELKSDKGTPNIRYPQAQYALMTGRYLF